jgi:oleandomycin transport system ATP-binding protein
VRPKLASDLPIVESVVARVAGATPEVRDGLVTVPAPDSDLLPVVVRQLDDAEVQIGELALRGASLDEVFLSLTGHPTEKQEVPV